VENLWALTFTSMRTEDIWSCTVDFLRALALASIPVKHIRTVAVAYFRAGTLACVTMKYPRMRACLDWFRTLTPAGLWVEPLCLRTRVDMGALALTGAAIEDVRSRTLKVFRAHTLAGVLVEDVWMGAVGSWLGTLTSAGLWIEPLRLRTI